MAKKNANKEQDAKAQNQPDLWSEVEPTPTVGLEGNVPAPKPRKRPAVNLSRERRTIQDLLFEEGLAAAKLSVKFDTLEALQERLPLMLGQNSMETRVRYAQSLMRWFFHDGIQGLARRTWTAYGDESIEQEILRFLYLSVEPIMGQCVADALFPLEEGILIPPGYFERFLQSFFEAEVPPKTRKRLKSNLMKLGFLARSRGKLDRLNPVLPQKTSFLLLLHHLFAPNGPRTIELRNLFSNPFWKYLGLKSEDAVRSILRDANAAGLLGKYVVADQLEQVTTCLTLDEILAKGIRL